MSRKDDAARRRQRLADLDAIRDGIDNFHGRVFTTDRRMRRLVRRGWVERAAYAHGAARDAIGEITPAGREAVEEADR